MTKLPPANIREFPRSLYRWKFGALVGLNLDDFHARLLRDDDLYNIVFWSVLDAFQLRELTENDVPASIVGMDQLLR